jgi:hypothetical protein
MPKMSYQEAAKIRQSGYFNEVSKNLMGNKGVGGSFKEALSSTAQAKATGIKEKFDPLNIAKKLSFGSSIGPALLGTLTGRSMEDIEYFTGLKSKKIKLGKTPKVAPPNSTAKEVLDNLYNMFSEKAEEEKAIREIKTDTAKQRESKKEKNHQELIEILDGIAGSRTTTETKEEEKDMGSLFKTVKLLAKNKGLFKGGKGSRIPPIVPGGASTASKIVLGGGLGLTALLAKGEAQSYDTAFGGQKTPKPLTQMTLKEIDQWQSKHPDENAVGKYQIVQGTLRGARKALPDLKDTDVFDEKLQDRIYREFLIGASKRPQLNAYLSGQSDVTIEAAQLDLAKEFASIPVPFDVTRPAMYGRPEKLVKKGDSYYGGIGKNRDKTNISIEETQKRLIEQRDLNSGKLKPEESSSGSIAIGDSLAEGIKNNNKIPGLAKAGAGPKAVFEMIQEYTKNNDIKGKQVFLGTGMPNNSAQAEYIQKQIDLIKEKGGKPIVLGVGPGTEKKPTTGQNEKLQAMTEKSGVTFTGDLNKIFTGERNLRKTDPTMGLHPTPQGYKDLFKQFSSEAAPAPASVKPNPVEIKKDVGQKVSALSKENNNMIASMDVGTQMSVNNNMISMVKPGDTNINIISVGDKKESVLMEKMLG